MLTRPEEELNLQTRDCAEHILEAKNLVKDFGRHRGIFEVSVALQRKSVVSLLGSNGSGKSTFMRCISLFDSVDKGSIWINGKFWGNRASNPREVDRLRASVIGVMFQQSEPWPHLNVLDNVMLPLLKGACINPAEARIRAEKALSTFGMLDRIKAMPYELSGGLRQRVCLARTFALEPQILLLDEVTSALDPDWTERVRIAIREFADCGGTVLNISHRIGFVRRVSDWIIFLDSGEVLEEGNPVSVLDDPTSPKFQKFLENA
jgi:ABC-type polar amino acid transport system ATPase subunit